MHHLRISILFFLAFTVTASFSQETTENTEKSNNPETKELEVKEVEKVDESPKTEIEESKEIETVVEKEVQIDAVDKKVIAAEQVKEESKSNENAKPRLKPMKSDWGFGFNVTGLIDNIKLENNEDVIGNSLLFFRHYLKDDLVLRLGVGAKRESNNTVRKDSLNGAFVQFDSSYTRFDFSLSGGIEKHFGNMRRLDPYIGGQFMIVFQGKENYDWNEVRNESPTVSTSITNEKTF